jgi:hypothetical protein
MIPQLAQWRFPHDLPAGSSEIGIRFKKNRRVPGAPHTNFKL